ncbi:MAG TPA: hypothetical protein PLR18_02935 [bacterium]|nr:hypothetical protein [bacterium]
MSTAKYLRAHEDFIKNKLADKKGDFDWPALQSYHRAQTQFFQHERLIHLLVTLTFGLASLIVFGLVLFFPSLILAFLNIIFLIMLFFYVRHYFLLENGIQRFYLLDQAISKKIITIL